MHVSGADPEFSVGGGANPPGGQTYNFVKISEKLHEIEKILGRRGGPHARSAPLRSATAYVCFMFQTYQ